MWADAQRNGRPRNIGGALCESCVGLIPFLVPRHKVWPTAAARVPCSNAANIERKTWTQSEFCTSQNSAWGQEPPKCCLKYFYLTAQHRADGSSTGAPVPRPLGPRGCSRPHNSSRQRAVELTRRIVAAGQIGRSTASARGSLIVSLQAYLGERYCITVPLVLISFGGTALPPKNTWGNGVPPRSLSTTPLTATYMCFGTVVVWKVRMKVLVLRRSPPSDLTEMFLQATTPCDLSSLTISSLEENIMSLHLTTLLNSSEFCVDPP